LVPSRAQKDIERWNKLGFGDLNQHGPDSIRFYTKTKTVTSRWPSGVKEGAEFSIPTMK
jgi:malonate-semialdehyde dehydrogenase (acetylating)/methylmalonate-semialdehyde dehydrogenase